MSEKMPPEFQSFWQKPKPVPEVKQPEANQEMFSKEWIQLLSAIKEASEKQWK